jgi:hypothetical protein
MPSKVLEFNFKCTHTAREMGREGEIGGGEREIGGEVVSERER